MRAVREAAISESLHDGANVSARNLIHAVFRPRPPLDRFVESIWVADEYVARAPRERVLPTGSPYLVILLGDRPVQVFESEDASRPIDVSKTIVCGARQAPLIIGTALGPTLGVQFKAGGARPFFDVPAEALAGRAASLEELWGSAAMRLREQLLQAETPVARAGLLEAALFARLRPSTEQSSVLRQALAAFDEPGLSSVAEVNRRTGLSPKRLLALFRDEVGLSPKAFWRVRRFRAVLGALGRGMRGPALAYEHGYYDQPHFIREFKAFAGSSLREYLTARVAGTDHVSVLR